MRTLALFGAAIVACVSVSSASAQACREPFDKQLETVLTQFSRLEQAVPAVPQSSIDYFEAEYGKAVYSQAPGRVKLVESQPFFKEWKVRSSIQRTRGTALLMQNTLPDKGTLSLPFASVHRTRILWAGHLLEYVHLLIDDVKEYVQAQRISPSPTLTVFDGLKMADTASSLPHWINQIVECEVRVLPDPPNDRSRPTYNGTSPGL